MWIRSQDKKTLVDASCFEIDEYCEGCEPEGNVIYRLLGGFNINQHCWLLGAYSTEEKALKVLDKIEEWIRYECCGVFQMPADDAVEV